VKARKVTIRPRAAGEIEDIAYYLDVKAGPEVAARFRTAVTSAIKKIRTMPGIGSPRYTTNPTLAGLRMVILPGFGNYLLFYLTPEGGVDIVRVLHGARDIDSLLSEEDLS
jgi:toxin ParE1/3/4